MRLRHAAVANGFIADNVDREEFAMPEYRIVFGAYVRMYADHTVVADNADAARKRAIEDFANQSAEFHWLDANYDNLALPSICSMQTDDPPGDVLEGYDFW